MTQTVKMYCKMLFTKRSIDTIKVKVNPENIGSVKVLEKIGFIKTGSGKDKKTENLINIMCLAIPGKILKIDIDKTANVDFNGVQKEVSLELVPKAQVGDYVLIHAGFAVECINEEEAQKTLDLIKEIPELA